MAENGRGDVQGWGEGGGGGDRRGVKRGADKARSKGKHGQGERKQAK